MSGSVNSATPGSCHVLSPEECRSLLIRHLGSRHEQPLAAAWTSHLKNPSPRWHSAMACATHGLLDPLQAVIELAQSLARTPPQPALHYDEWLRSCRELLPHWPPPNLKGWELIFITPPHSQNLIVKGVVARVLSDTLRDVKMPSPLSSPLYESIREDLRAFDNVLLPPNPVASNQTADYIIGPAAAGLDLELGRLTAEIRRSMSALDQAAFKSELLAAVRNLDVVRKLDAVLVSTERIIELLQFGWPILVDGLNRRQQELADVLALLAANLLSSGYFTTSQLEIWRQALQFRIGTTQTVALASVVVRGRTRSSDRLPQNLSSAAESSLRLIRLADRLSQADEPRSREFAQRLITIVQGVPQEKSEHSLPDFDSEYYRQILSCLVYLDESLQRENRSSGWILEARHELRSLVEQSQCFQILDGQLVGRNLIDVASTVLVVGHLATNRFPAGHIGKVQQPGYALGTGELLSPAKVLVTRPAHRP